MTNVFCKDCRWFMEPQTNQILPRCKATEKENLVTGKPLYNFCDSERHMWGACGIEGKNYIPNMDDPVTVWPFNETQNGDLS
jgi:hypothetical protein